MKETEYVEGKKHGTQTCFDPDGNPVKITTYENNVRVYEETYYKGQIVSKTSYFNGKKEGKCELFEKGIKVSEANYANGKKDGIETKFYPDGTVECSQHYENGKRGNYTSYHSNGNLRITEIDGIRTDYDKSGIPITQSGFEGEKYFYKGYYGNGVVGQHRIGDDEHFYDPDGNEISHDEFWAAECEKFVGWRCDSTARPKFTEAMYITKRDAVAKKRMADYRQELRDFGTAWTKPLKITPVKCKPIAIPQESSGHLALPEPEVVVQDVAPDDPKTFLMQYKPEPPKLGFWGKLLAKFT
jgi:antitoxin component YwqK of YwqJK toxin-antitoxin module